MQEQFKRPEQALAALGLSVKATPEDVKSAYHKLMSLYHPDANGGRTEEKFYRIRDAHEYLLEAMEEGTWPAEDGPHSESSQSAETVAGQDVAMSSQAGQTAGQRPVKIFGNKSAFAEAKLKRKFAAEHAKQEERLRRRHEAEKLQRLKDESRQRENKAYEEAMMKIRAIRAAEIAANIYRAQLRRDT